MRSSIVIRVRLQSVGLGEINISGKVCYGSRGLHDKNQKLRSKSCWFSERGTIIKAHLMRYRFDTVNAALRSVSRSECG
jgi:hypothetical protein